MSAKDIQSQTVPSIDLQNTGSPKEGIPFQSRKVLVADDDEGVLSLITRALSAAGCDVSAVADGLQAWEALLHRSYDLVVTDNEMPHMTGLELIRRIREVGLAVPVVIASGSRLGETFDDPSDSVTLILPKPFCMFQLLGAVQNALQSSTSPHQGASEPSYSHFED